MKKIIIGLTGLLAALGLAFVAVPANAAPTSSDDVAPTVIGHFNDPLNTPVYSDQSCAPIPAGATAVTLTTGRLSWYSDLVCATQTGSIVSGPGTFPIPAGALMYSTQ